MRITLSFFSSLSAGGIFTSSWSVSISASLASWSPFRVVRLFLDSETSSWVFSGSTSSGHSSPSSSLGFSSLCSFVRLYSAIVSSIASFSYMRISHCLISALRDSILRLLSSYCLIEGQNSEPGLRRVKNRGSPDPLTWKLSTRFRISSSSMYCRSKSSEYTSMG